MNKLLIGKTVERVETPVPSPYNGRPDESRIALYFTDGTVVEVKGGGDDCDGWVEVESFSHSEQLERAHKAVDYERGIEESHIKRREWMALSCGERQATLTQRRAEQKPGNLLMEGAMLSMLTDFLEPRITFFDQPGRVVRDPCPKCRERECPNAPTRTIPAKRGIIGSAFSAEVGSSNARK